MSTCTYIIKMPKKVFKKVNTHTLTLYFCFYRKVCITQALFNTGKIRLLVHRPTYDQTVGTKSNRKSRNCIQVL